MESFGVNTNKVHRLYSLPITWWDFNMVTNKHVLAKCSSVNDSSQVLPVQTWHRSRTTGSCHRVNYSWNCTSTSFRIDINMSSMYFTGFGQIWYWLTRKPYLHSNYLTTCVDIVPNVSNRINIYFCSTE